MGRQLPPPRTCVVPVNLKLSLVHARNDRGMSGILSIYRRVSAPYDDAMRWTRIEEVKEVLRGLGYQGDVVINVDEDEPQ